jgi:hypothetical protein
MKLSHLFLLVLIAVFATACGGGDAVMENLENSTGAVSAPETNDGLPGAGVSVEEPVVAESADAGEEQAAPAASEPAASLTTDYAGALSIGGQLALGTLHLEETALAVDEAQAAALLPLWQALQSLRASDTAATAEIDAVERQITQTMTPAQIAAIREMALTVESLAGVDLGVGVGLGRQGGQGTGTGTGPGGGVPGMGGGMGMGRGLGGGTPAGEVDEATMATRQAERESGVFQEQALTFAVVRLLQTKTGELPANAAGTVGSTVLNVVATETGLAVEEVEAQLAAGNSLVEIITTAGANVDAVRAAAATAIGAMENAAELDVEAILERWFSPEGEN